MMKLFVGFDFANTSLLARKVTGFRKRFDPKYLNYSFAHMAMLAPFEALDYQAKDLIEALKEELETFFWGHHDMPTMGITGLGVYQQKRKKILYLNPHLDTNLEHCQEFVQDICSACMAPGFKYKANKMQFLPLGYFYEDDNLSMVMEQAKMEFTNYGELPIESISLYEKRGNRWYQREVLISFENSESHFLHLNQKSL